MSNRKNLIIGFVTDWFFFWVDFFYLLDREVCEEMSQESGLQKLLDAEREAQDIVSTARKERDVMVKNSRREADEEVRRYREERDAQFREYVQQFKGVTESYVSKLKGISDKEIAGIRAVTEQKGDEVVDLLVKAVTEVDYSF